MATTESKLVNTGPAPRGPFTSIPSTSLPLSGFYGSVADMTLMPNHLYTTILFNSLNQSSHSLHPQFIPSPFLPESQRATPPATSECLPTVSLNSTLFSMMSHQSHSDSSLPYTDRLSNNGPIAAVPSTIDSIQSSPANSPARFDSSSPDEMGLSKVKRGRPQQDIDDEGDPNSLKRRHRRLYARQYRAQMRNKVDEVKVLRTKLDERDRKIEKLEAELASERRENQQMNMILTGMLSRR